MSVTQHQDLAHGRWFTLTLAQQLGNIGSDFDRALYWKQKGHERLFASAAARTLELLDLTLADRRLNSPRRKEMARLRDEVCRELFVSNNVNESSHSLQRYFLSMATLAQNEQRVTEKV